MAYNEAETTIGHGWNVLYAANLAGLSSGTPIDGTTGVHFPDGELGEMEITNDDTADFMKDYHPGLYDPGTVAFTYKFGKTQYAVVEAVYQECTVAATRATAASRYWKIVAPDGSFATFKGFLKKHAITDSDQEDALEVECEIRVRGKITFTAGT